MRRALYDTPVDLAGDPAGMRPHRPGTLGSLTPRDWYREGRRYRIRLHEKRGHERILPLHYEARELLEQYAEASGAAAAPAAPIFRAAARDGQLTERALQPRHAWRMIQRRARAADLASHAGCHTFRASAITLLRQQGATLERMQRFAGHKQPKTTLLYDRTARDLPDRGRAHSDLSIERWDGREKTMGWIDTLAQVYEIAQTAKNTALIAATAKLNLELAQVMAEKADLTQENIVLRGEVAALKEQLALRKKLTFEENVYWMKQEDAPREGPFCPACFDGQGKVIRMQAKRGRHITDHYQCTVCDCAAADPHGTPAEPVRRRISRSSGL
jgi:hypothetical protein